MEVLTYPQYLGVEPADFPKTVSEALCVAQPAMSETTIFDISLSLVDVLSLQMESCLVSEEVLLAHWGFQRTGGVWLLTEARHSARTPGRADIEHFLHAFRETLRAHRRDGYREIRLNDARDTANISYLFARPVELGERLLAWVPANALTEFIDVASREGYAVRT